MKPRIEKKLSKRLVEIAPTLFPGAWVDKEVELFEKHYCWQNDRPLTAKQERENRQQKVGVNNIWSVGGGVDYWGEGMDAYTCWVSWRTGWMWHGSFDPYPEGHKHEFFPNTEGFKPTTRNLLRLAEKAEQEAIAKRNQRG